MKTKYYVLCISAVAAVFIPILNHYHFECAPKTCVLTFSNEKNASAPQKTSQAEPWITIWIHGTRFFSRPFFKKFFDVPQGLNKASTLSMKYHHRCIAQTLYNEDPHNFDLNHFYLFGWSGDLSIEARKKAAQQLAYALKKLLKDTDVPRIRIITHSHGGNVALYLAQQDTTLTIDELILLACPVQKYTKQLIKHPMFKNIISLYSAWDSIQVLDPQGLHDIKDIRIDSSSPLFSERTFPEQPNLAQIELWHNYRGPMHLEFLLCDSLSGIVRLLPEILATTKEHFSTQFSESHPKPVQKLAIMSKPLLEWQEKGEQILHDTSATVKKYLEEYKSFF